MDLQIEYTPTPTYHFTQFSFTETETYRTATSVPAPTATHTYAPPYSALSSLIPDLSTTTWGNWNPNATAQPTDAANPYSNAAWTVLWQAANLSNLTEIPLYTLQSVLRHYQLANWCSLQPTTLAPPIVTPSPKTSFSELQAPLPTLRALLLWKGNLQV